jgi:hypothetical protein
MADDGNQTQGNGETPPDGETPTFDEWYGGQEESVQGLITGHIDGLKASLQSERTAKKSLAKELRTLSKQVDEGSEAAKQLESISGKLETAETQARFYEEAAAAGCSDMRLAWLAASADDLSLDEVKAAHPHLFVQPRAASSNAGNGAQAPPSTARSMNDFIRQAAGRG